MVDSMLDGTPTLRMNEFMLAGIEKGQIPLELPEAEKTNTPMPSPHEVVFEMDHKLKSAVAKSYQGFGEEMAQQDLKVSLLSVPSFLVAKANYSDGQIRRIW